MLKGEREKDEGLLLILGGDVVSPVLLSAGYNPTPYFSALRELGFTFLCAGSSELAMDPLYLNSAVLQLIASNVRRDHVKPFYRLKAKGMSLAILSVVSPDLLPPTTTLEDPLLSLLPLIKGIRDRVDLLVLYGYMREQPFVDLLRRLEGVDLAILGSVMGYREPRKIGDTLLVGIGGQWVGFLDLAWQQGKLVPVRFKPLHLSGEISKDPKYLPIEQEALRVIKKSETGTCSLETPRASEGKDPLSTDELRELLQLPPEEAIKRLQQRPLPFKPSR